MESLVVQCEWMEVRGGDTPGKLPPSTNCCLTYSATRLAWGGAVPPLSAQLLSWGWRTQSGVGNWYGRSWLLPKCQHPGAS